MTTKFGKMISTAAILGSFLVASQAAARSIQITDNMDQPVAGAEVLVYESSAKPIAPVPVFTDSNGMFTVPKSTKANLSFTVTAPDFIKTSFLNIPSDMGVLQINTADPAQMIEIQGDTVGFGALPKDGQVDFALVYPALTRRGLINFDVSSLMSPEFDTIKVSVQEVTLPSNLTLPEQKETYILPITLKKPTYRMFVKQAGDYRMMATHGQFPLKKVISDMQGGKSMFELINYFDFKDSGFKDLSVSGPMKAQNIDVSQIKFDSTTSITAPALVGRQRMVSAAAYSMDGYFFPTDVKNVASEQTQTLKTLSARSNETYFVSVLTIEPEKAQPLASFVGLSPEAFLGTGLEAIFNMMNGPSDPAASEGREVSVSLQPMIAGAKAEFMSLVPAPIINGDMISMQQPMAPAGITPVATYLTLAEIQTTQQGNYQTEKRFRLWELLQPGWTNQIQLPVNDFIPEAGKTYRWEVMYLGTTAAKQSNTYFLDSITHVSRNSRNL